MDQDMNFESDEWAEKEYLKMNMLFYKNLTFQIFLYSDFLNKLVKDDLRFVYQDSTGTRKDGIISFYELDETKKPIYSVYMLLAVSLSYSPQDITWFSLHILNQKLNGRVDTCWEFGKD